MSDVIENTVEDLSFEHSQHNRYEPKCSECFSLNKFWEEITPEQEELIQDAFDAELEIGGMPITKDNFESLYESWSENLSLEEIQEILKPKYSCEICEDKGFIAKTEWAEPNESYDVEKKCVCQED